MDAHYDLKPALDSLIAPSLHHPVLATTFHGIQHPLSTPETEIHQFRGIKYAAVPARFRRSTLFTAYGPHTNATVHGPIAPQTKQRNLEQRLYNLEPHQIPRHNKPLRQDEYECLNLNITRPGHLTPDSRLPVMLWIHGGGNVSGSGSDWMTDGGHLVRKSMQLGKPVIIVAINYRLGLLGFAASELLRREGEEGVGNYGLFDQRTAMEWVKAYISAFGGDPDNVTLFGASVGASDIHCHMLSAYNADSSREPLFRRVILQSGALAPSPSCVFDLPTAAGHLARIMSVLQISTLEELQAVEPERLVVLTGERVRPVDEDTWFRPDWHTLTPSEAYNGNIPQDIIIGDCGGEAALWALPAELWTDDTAVRRVRAICANVYRADALLRAYDIDSHTPEDEIAERVLDVIGDALWGWVIERAARAAAATSDSGGPKVYRYIFDQASPYTDAPHHAIDLLYLFANVPLPELEDLTPEENEEYNWDRIRVRDAIQDRFLAFANGEAPWTPLSSAESSFSPSSLAAAISPSSSRSSSRSSSPALSETLHTPRGDKIYVFGPEGETGERGAPIFEGRRRVDVWMDAFEPLGLRVVHKVGRELGNGPPLGRTARF